MLAARAISASPDDPLSALEIGEVDEPNVPEGWALVEVKATSLNHHDVWSLRGVGLPEERLPMIIGCDAAGVDADGNEVIVHAVIGDPDFPGGEIIDPRRTLLSELHPGTLAERVAVPRRNLVPKPPSLSFEEACCLPTAWLTAYRMLFDRSGLKPGQTVLVQGAGGGVASAAIELGRAAGFRVWATSREQRKLDFATECGAHAVFESGARLPEKVDVVLETVGKATWGHSLRALKPGGRIVVAGSTSGPDPSAELNRVFFKELEVVGSTMGTLEELGRLVSLVDLSGIRPRIDKVLPLAEVADGLRSLAEGDVLGKIVITP
ncbi:MAG TPA: zinc-binding dehydrogenase [Solirubrobacterales bacterium]|jgi:NADPH:quinone reductase-like Zn-dependent oxidoreductase|nr:zinc-binding dehydrogenase [Solirubrobacterales bacterium]